MHDTPELETLALLIRIYHIYRILDMASARNVSQYLSSVQEMCPSISHQLMILFMACQQHKLYARFKVCHCSEEKILLGCEAMERRVYTMRNTSKKLVQ
jgi:hypothetical protein